MTSLNNPKTLQSANILAFPRGQSSGQQRATIVVPCYNEADRLNTRAFADFLNQDNGVNIVFVNDGSKDATLDVLESIHSMHSDRVEVLSLTRNGGKAEAVRQGLLYATRSSTDFVGYWDADLATPLDAIEDFVRVGRRFDEVEVIFGARRMLLGHRVERALLRRAVSRICAALARVAVRLPVGDTQCGAKLLRNSPQLKAALDTPFAAGWLFDVELFTRISDRTKNGHVAFYEFPLAEWTEIAGSKVSGQVIVRSGFSMLRLIAESRFGLPRSDPRYSLPDVNVVCSAASASKAA